jgi:hypothetical protein
MEATLQSLKELMLKIGGAQTHNAVRVTRLDLATHRGHFTVPAEICGAIDPYLVWYPGGNLYTLYRKYTEQLCDPIFLQLPTDVSMQESTSLPAGLHIVDMFPRHYSNSADRKIQVRRLTYETKQSPPAHNPFQGKPLGTGKAQLTSIALLTWLVSQLTNFGKDKAAFPYIVSRNVSRTCVICELLPSSKGTALGMKSNLTGVEIHELPLRQKVAETAEARQKCYLYTWLSSYYLGPID